MKYVWRLEATYTDHRVVEAIARDLEAYTPSGGEFYAFEAVYFASHQEPPTLENRFNPFSQSDEWLKNGRFDAIRIGSTNPRVKEFELFSRYASSKEINLNGNTTYIFWDEF
jgi:hypothetical protein